MVGGEVGQDAEVRIQLVGIVAEEDAGQFFENAEERMAGDVAAVGF